MNLDISQILAILGFLFGGGAGVWVIFKVVAEKKLRTPGDKRSDIELGVKLLTDAQEQDRKDKDLNDKQIATLRQWVNDLIAEAQQNHVDKQSLYDRIGELQARVSELVERNDEKTRRIRELEDRISHISHKLLRGETITLADLAGVEDELTTSAYEDDLADPPTGPTPQVKEMA